MLAGIGNELNIEVKMLVSLMQRQARRSREIQNTPNLYGKLKAIEYMHFMAQLYPVANERIAILLDMFELTSKVGTYLDGFSHLMQQKVVIIVAFPVKPK